ncbi:MAG: hypothetical protein DDT42_00178 [candidate division WS2 bacterium]|uniref:Transposase IS204/IS1001/IS1096/IS1165 zinc-finger domain-containing protein n=1 Tax=Psychracetigena formicireducens TaxID=2986056 RepID=A0A9E2F689_PSYF1|nr:hypothetical protein [Candidatus Psychracetigena formicireducens]MBT9144343.1 hypothetical protein [Candidatus Psychracetigena formicireducens]
MLDDSITVRLGLPVLRILEQWELENYFQVKVIYLRSKANCLKCGKVTTKVHDRRLQYKKDRGLRDKIVLLKILKRRFRCPLERKVFTEPDEVFGLRRRSSRRFREYLGREALHQTVRRVAQKERVGEGLVRTGVAEEIGRMLKAKGVK